MKRIHLHDTATGQTRTITRFGEGVEVVRSKTEVEVSSPPPPDPRRDAMRELSRMGQLIEHRQALYRMDLGELLRRAIDQGFFDRLIIEDHK